MEHTQTRDLPGPQMRTQLRQHDVVRHLRDARLPATQRTVVLDYIETAILHDGRDELGGARFLYDLAADIPETLGNLRSTVQSLATSFVHPRLR